MTDSLVDILQLDGRGIITLIGAGGKTSLMFQLAKMISQSQSRVLTTTTTKIFMPEPYQSPSTIIEDDVEKLLNRVKLNLNTFSHFSAGSRYDKKSDKITGFTPDIIHKLWQTKIFDWIIVEADGARQKPVKASNRHEPVIPEDTTHLILVTGVDAVGKTVDSKHVHRPEIFADNTGSCEGDIINEECIAAAIDFELKKSKSFCSPSFRFVLLNKADSVQQTASGKKIGNFLKKDISIEKIIITSLKDRVEIKHIV